MNYVKTALITGASRGIGAAAARALARDGWRVAVHYNSLREKAEALAAGIGNGAMCFQADLSDKAECEKLAASVVHEFGGVDLLVNNAGISLWRMAQDTSDDEWDKLFAVNARAPFILSKVLLPGMIERRTGGIINISSMWGQAGAACESAYSASKAALIGYTKALAKEVGSAGIRVNCICPGVIDTDMMKAFDENAKNELADETPLGRLGTPEDVAKAVLWLAGDGAGFVTGQIIGINGGFII